MDWSAILTGGMAVALIEGCHALIMWGLNRHAEKEDREDAGMKNSFEDIDKRLDNQDVKLDGCTYGLRILLHDRIKYLGQKYLHSGAVDFDDRQILLDMHNAYHNSLGGNGNLDALMESVKALPIKGENDNGE